MIPILLTSTIKPHQTDGIFAVRQTENERFLEYKSVLGFYQQKLRKTPLVFADNSKSRLVNQLTENETIEVINFPVPDESKIRGKGFGEGLLINEVLQKSHFLSESQDFIKVTGRYKIYNIKRFIRLLSAARGEYDFVALEFRYYGLDVPVSPTYMFYSTVLFWKEHLASVYKQVDDKNGPAFEKLVTDKLVAAAVADGRVGTFPFPALLLRRDANSGESSIRRSELLRGRIKTCLAQAFKKQPAIKPFVLPADLIRSSQSLPT